MDDQSPPPSRQDAPARAEELISRSDAPVIRMYLGQALFYLGKTKEAADLLAGIRRGAEPDMRSQAALAAVLAATGRPDEARATIEKVLQRRAAIDHHVRYSLGAAFAQLGRSREAVTWLQSSIDDGFPSYPWFVSDPLLEPIRGDAAYQKLIAGLRSRFETTRSQYAAR